MADPATKQDPTFGGEQPDQLDRTVAGLLSIRDRPAFRPRRPRGTATFSTGSGPCRKASSRAPPTAPATGPTTCRSPKSHSPTPRDASTGGDLLYDEAVTDVSSDIQGYWSRAYPRLAGHSWTRLPVTPFDPADPPRCAGRQLTPQNAAGAAY